MRIDSDPWAKLSKAEQGWARLSKAEQSWAELSRAEQSWAKAEQSKTVPKIELKITKISVCVMAAIWNPEWCSHLQFNCGVLLSACSLPSVTLLNFFSCTSVTTLNRCRIIMWPQNGNPWVWKDFIGSVQLCWTLGSLPYFEFPTFVLKPVLYLCTDMRSKRRHAYFQNPKQTTTEF